MQFNADKDVILADEVHFTNLINNLLDNAVKYSKESLQIKLTTVTFPGNIRIKIEEQRHWYEQRKVLSWIFENFTVHIPATYIM